MEDLEILIVKSNFQYFESEIDLKHVDKLELS